MVKKCKECGFENEDTSKSCLVCGNPFNKGNRTEQKGFVKFKDRESLKINHANHHADYKEVTGLGVASLVFGIIGLLFFPILFGIIALFFGLISSKHDGLGAAGIILGIIDIVIGLILFWTAL